MVEDRMQEPASPPMIVPAPGVDLDIFGIREFWEDAKEWVLSAEGPVLRLDLSGVGDLDLSGLQVLVSMFLALEKKGGALELSGVKPEWVRRMEWLGFDQLRAACLEGGS